MAIQQMIEIIVDLGLSSIYPGFEDALVRGCCLSSGHPALALQLLDLVAAAFTFGLV